MQKVKEGKVHTSAGGIFCSLLVLATVGKSTSPDESASADKPGVSEHRFEYPEPNIAPFTMSSDPGKK